MRFFDPLKRNAQRVPNDPCLFSEHDAVTYREADSISDKVAGGLVGVGIQRGDRVCIFAANSVRYALAMYGIVKAGAIAALVDGHDASKLGVYARRLQPRALLFSADLAEAVQANHADLPPARQRVCLDGTVPEAQAWEAFLAQAPPVAPTTLETVEDEDPCHLAFTSGTTYEPKPAVLMHGPTMRSAHCIAERLGLTGRDVCLGITTLSSSHILVYTILAGMVRHATVGVLEGWDPVAAWGLLRFRGVTVVSGTALRLGELVEAARERGYDKAKLRLVLSGGYPAYGSLRDKWTQLGVPFVETYGMSELGGFAAMGDYRFPQPRRLEAYGGIHAIGLPAPDRETRVVDAQDGELPPGTPGEIVIRGGYMWGYWGMPQETTEATRNGWLHTSDIGIMDADDYVYWLGRKTDVIHVAGQAVFPRPIEEVLSTHPSVEQLAVVGIPDPEVRERPVAFVVLRPGTTATQSELLAHCKRSLRPDQVPHYIAFREHFPMTASGKIERKQLRKEKPSLLG
jgi:acyl-CoA synthetase (AMP-forming)/AMP-acid ligase II